MMAAEDGREEGLSLSAQLSESQGCPELCSLRAKLLKASATSAHTEPGALGVDVQRAPLRIWHS